MGADLDNCYFSDPNVNVLDELITNNVTGLAEYDSTGHRKIRQAVAQLCSAPAAAMSMQLAYLMASPLAPM